MRVIDILSKSILFAALFTSATFLLQPAQASELLRSPVEVCKQELYAERDKQWHSKLKAALQKHQLSAEGKADYERLKRELRDEIKYLGFIDPGSDFALIAGQTFQSIKTKANLIEDLLSFASVKKVGEATAKALYKLIKAYRKVDGAVDHGTNWLLFDIIKDFDPVTNTIVNLADNISTAVRMPGEHAAFQSEMDKQLARLDKEIAKMEQRMREAEHEVQVYDALGRAIEMYCDENPNDITPSLVEESPPDTSTDLARASEMDAFVDAKREDDRNLIMDQMVAAKQAYDSDIQSGSSGSNGDDVDAFFGGLLEGVIMGLDIYNSYQGGSSGGYSGGGSSSSSGCAQVRAQIEADRNYLAANSGSAADGAIRAAINENVAYYNRNCL